MCFLFLEFKPIASHVRGKVFSLSHIVFFTLFHFKMISHLVVPDGMGFKKDQAALEIATPLPLHCK